MFAFLKEISISFGELNIRKYFLNIYFSKEIEIWIRKLSRVLCGGGVCENYLMNTGLKSSHIHISSQSLRISAIASHTVSEGFSL